MSKTIIGTVTIYSITLIKNNYIWKYTRYIIYNTSHYLLELEQK